MRRLGGGCNLNNYSSSRVNTSRDVLLLRIDENRSIAVSCDAAGAIGSKMLDSVRADAKLVGKLTARVALMELLAIGADPIAISGTFSVEPKPTGESLIEGIRREVEHAHLGHIRIVSSSEKNFKVKQTGIGITAIGLVLNSMTKIGRCEQGDNVFAVGELRVGREVIQAEASRRIADTLDVARLRRSSFVHELIPAGSKGVLHEVDVMAKDSGLSFDPLVPYPIALDESAGPASVLLVAAREGNFTRIKKAVGRKQVRKIGALRGR